MPLTSLTAVILLGLGIAMLGAYAHALFNKREGTEHIVIFLVLCPILGIGFTGWGGHALYQDYAYPLGIVEGRISRVEVVGRRPAQTFVEIQGLRLHVNGRSSQFFAGDYVRLTFRQGTDRIYTIQSLPDPSSVKRPNPTIWPPIK